MPWPFENTVTLVFPHSVVGVGVGEQWSPVFFLGLTRADSDGLLSDCLFSTRY